MDKAIIRGRADKGKITRLEDYRRRGRERKPARRPLEGIIRAHAETLKKAAEQGHLLPVKFSHDDDSTRLANVPWDAAGGLYVRVLLRHFPQAYLRDVTHMTCRIDRIEFTGLYDISDTGETLTLEHEPGPAFPLLAVNVELGDGRRSVQVANIIADPLGRDIFLRIAASHPDRCFLTAELERLPISAIDIRALRELYS